MSPARSRRWGFRQCAMSKDRAAYTEQFFDPVHGSWKMVGMPFDPRCAGLESPYWATVDTQGSPILSWIYDQQRDYPEQLYFLGVWSLIRGVIMAYEINAGRTTKERMRIMTLGHCPIMQAFMQQDVHNALLHLPHLEAPKVTPASGLHLAGVALDGESLLDVLDVREMLLAHK